MKIISSIIIEATSTDVYFRERSASIYGAKSNYKFTEAFEKVVLVHKNSDTGEERTVIVDGKDFYNDLEYKGTYEGNILNRFRY